MSRMSEYVRTDPRPPFHIRHYLVNNRYILATSTLGLPASVARSNYLKLSLTYVQGLLTFQTHILMLRGYFVDTCTKVFYSLSGQSERAMLV